MNAPSPALVAQRPERLRLVGQRRQLLAVMHQRLMFGMLVFAGIVAIIALRILYLAAFGDHAGRKEELTSFVPERGDIVDRNGDPTASIRRPILRRTCSAIRTSTDTASLALSVPSTNIWRIPPRVASRWFCRSTVASSRRSSMS